MSRTTRSTYRVLALPILGLLMSAGPVQAQGDAVKVVVKIESLVPENGVYFSPVWVGFHDGGFDLFDVGSLASEAIERIAAALL